VLLKRASSTPRSGRSWSRTPFWGQSSRLWHGSRPARLFADGDRHRPASSRALDGTGYGWLAGEAILVRITTFADVCDLLRSRLVYKPGLHGPSRRLILRRPGQFDPNLLAAFRQCRPASSNIFSR
jgi:hypothetical protein